MATSSVFQCHHKGTINAKIIKNAAPKANPKISSNLIATRPAIVSLYGGGTYSTGLVTMSLCSMLTLITGGSSSTSAFVFGRLLEVTLPSKPEGVAGVFSGEGLDSDEDTIFHPRIHIMNQPFILTYGRRSSFSTLLLLPMYTRFPSSFSLCKEVYTRRALRTNSDMSIPASLAKSFNAEYVSCERLTLIRTEVCFVTELLLVLGSSSGSLAKASEESDDITRSFSNMLIPS